MTDLSGLFIDSKWKTEYDLVIDSNLPDQLEIPRNALKTLYDDKLQKIIIEQSGQKKSFLYPFIRRGITKIISDAKSGAALTMLDEAIASLIVEALINPSIKFFPLSETELRNILKEMTEGIFVSIKNISPHKALRPSIHPDLLRRTDPETMPKVSRVIVEALKLINSGSPLPNWSKVYISLLRTWILNSTSNNGEGKDLKSLLVAADITEEKLKSIQDEIKQEANPESLFMKPKNIIDYQVLCSKNEFQASAEYYGFRFDTNRSNLIDKISNHIHEIKDPWVRLLHSVAIGDGVFAEKALAELAKIEPNETIDRAKSIKFILVSGIYASEKDAIQIIIANEFEAVLATTQPRADLILFHDLIVAKFTNSLIDFESNIHNLGVHAWFNSCFEIFCRNKSGSNPEKLHTAEWIQLDPDKFRSCTLLTKSTLLANYIVKRKLDVKKSSLRQESESAGRGWLFDFLYLFNDVVTFTEFYKSQNILIDSDSEILKKLIKIKDEGKDHRWWALSIDTATEMRIMEASARKTREVLPGLSVVANQMKDLLLRSIEPQFKESAERELQLCVNAVIDGYSYPANNYMEAFRAGDAATFRNLIEGSDAVLPVTMTHAKRINLNTYILLFLLIILSIALSWRMLFSETLPKQLVPGTPLTTTKTSSESAFDPNDPVQVWKPIIPGKSWYLIVDEQQFGRFFGPSLRSTTGRQGPATVEFSLANEFVRRYSLWLRGEYGSGLIASNSGNPVEVPWDALQFRLLSNSDTALISKLPRTQEIWGDVRMILPVKGGSMVDCKFNDPFKKGGICVIIETK